MADNFAFTPGVGATGAAKDIGAGVLAQRFKFLGDGDTDLELVLGQSTMAASLGVVIASDQSVLAVGGTKKRVTVELTLAHTTAYVAGDQCGGVLTLAQVARANDKSGTILWAGLVSDKNGIAPRYRIQFWNASPTVAADLAPETEVYTEVAASLLGSIDLLSMASPVGGGPSRASSPCDIPFICTGGVDDIYVTLVSLDAWTPSNPTKITVMVIVEQD
jgi:hypothetical protein